jgi:Bifunctional DNA primase/polymerase, N-terminal
VQRSAAHWTADQVTSQDTAAGLGGSGGLSLVHIACEAARRGWAVFPCRPGDKRPAVPEWEQKATSDPDQVRRSWPSPRHNVGIACGPSRLVVLDLDAHGDLPQEWQLPGLHDGKDVLAQLAEWAGQPWPSTYMVATPSGGWHMYYVAPEGGQIRNSASLISPQVDVRAGGGYVLGAGSVVDGRPYEPLDGCDPEPLPAWLCRLLSPSPGPRSSPPPRPCSSPSSRLAGLVRTVETARRGQRNHVLFWAGCRAAELEDADAETVTAALMAAVLTAGLGEREARRTLRSALGGDH